MKIHRKVLASALSIGLGIASVLCAPGSAQAAPGAGGFIAASGADANNLYNSTDFLYNTSTTATLRVTTSMPNATGFGNNYTVYGYGNGSNVLCGLFVYNYTTHAVNSYWGSSTASGYYTIGLSYPAQAGFVSVECRIPPNNGSASYLYGIQ